ncbi:MAG: hypothetical protein M1840_002075 [Geoglossum simile]|nr:MAG: hypothetical protein M1840_002075 [Geoglossum simile]
MDRIAQNQVLYHHDFHPRWFFDRPLENFIQIASRPILNPIVIQTRGRPRKPQQPKSSTARDPSYFERELPATKDSVKVRTRRQAQKRTRTRQQKKLGQPAANSSSSEYHDSSEDALMQQETMRLFESQGEADPLWT